MSIENPTPTETTQTPTETAPQVAAPAQAVTPAPKTFSQEQLNEVAAKARREGREAAQRETQQPAVKPAPTTGADDMATMKAELEEMKQRGAFDKRVAKLALPEDRADDLFLLFKAQRPEDPTAWVETKVKGFGWNVQTQPTTPAPAATPASPATAPAAPAAAPSAPQTHALPTAMGFPDIWNMTTEQFVQFRAGGQLRPTLEKMWAVGATQQGAPRQPTLPQK